MALVLFGVGVIEMLIAALWTSYVSRQKIMASGLITLINITIWFYVLQAIIDNINRWNILVFYALGCAGGTMLATWYTSRFANRQN